MKKKCEQCGKEFEAKRADKRFCSRDCVYKAYNDKRPRKTNKSYIKANILKSQHIPDEQLEIIYGCLLGDGSLVLQTDNFHRLSLCHSDKQEDYIEFKRNILNSIFMQLQCNEYLKKDGHTQFHCHSVSHKELTNLYGLLYINKTKRVTRRFLNLLTPTSLLFWFLDDGSNIKSSGHSAIICTDSFTLSEIRAIKIWFWQKYQIESKISEAKGSFNDNIYYRIRFTKENTIKLFNVISTSPFFNQIPSNIKYKFFPYFI